MRVLQWIDLTTCDVSVSPGALICQIHAGKINRFVDNGLEIRVRCGGWSRQLYVTKIKGGGPRIRMSSGRKE